MKGIEKAIREEIARQSARQIKAAGVVSQLKKISVSLARIEKRLNSIETGKSAGAARTAPARRSRKVDGRKMRFSIAGLKKLRAKLGVTQQELAKLLSVSSNSVWQWEAGRARPRMKTIEQIRALRSVGKREARARLEA